jgi:hypothetical protein
VAPARRSRRRHAARVPAGDQPACAADRAAQQPPEPGRPRPRPGRPHPGDAAATRQLDVTRLEAALTGGEHQPDRPGSGWAAQPLWHRRERAERGGQGTNARRVPDRDAAREELTEAAGRRAGHDPVHRPGGRAERHACRRTGGGRRRRAASARRCVVLGTAGGRAAARRQPGHGPGGDHCPYPPHGHESWTGRSRSRFPAHPEPAGGRRARNAPAIAAGPRPQCPSRGYRRSQPRSRMSIPSQRSSRR